MPTHTSLSSLLGSSLAKQAAIARDRGDYVEAERLFRLAAPGDNGVSYSDLGLMLANIRRFPEALEVLELSIKADPNQVQPWVTRSLIYQEQGEVALALGNVGAAVCITPENPALLNMMGKLLQKSGRYKEAMLCHHEAIKRAPDDAEYYYQLGLAMEHEEAIDAARELFEATLARDPDHTGAYVGLCGVYYRQKRDQDCIALAEQAKSRSRSNAAILALAGSAYARQGQRTEAATAFRMALATAPNDGYCHHRLAALEGWMTPRAPAEFVRRVFDALANDYDTTVTGTTPYTLPQTVAEIAGRHLSTPVAAAIDLGAGTGLIGVAIRPLTEQLHGVDLSPRMIAKLNDRKLYDTVATMDALEALAADGERCGLITAIGVLPYLGDLSTLIAAAAKRLAPGGLLIVTIETQEGTGYALRPSGRFVHNLAYIEKIAAAHGLTIVEKAVASLPVPEGDGPVAGMILALQPAASL
ncbi:MAG: tetratricopeptide repeat protein [Azospirillaceae bacterium]|nr:tetratricopeptide repeat protein [Azospirillaceae bacterium]